MRYISTKKIIIFIVMILFLFIIFILCFNNIMIGKRFIRAIGLTEISSYENMIGDMGTPLREGIEENKYNTTYNVYYDGVCLVFEKYNGFIERIDITEDKYRIGFASVGANINLLKNIYFSKKKVKDLPDNQFGIIENDLWIVFNFNENDVVDRIRIYYGP